MSDISESGSILREIKARTATLEACAGHTFVRLAPDDPRRFSTRIWLCTKCEQVVDATYGVAYMQGLQHAQKGHTKEAVFPKDSPPGV